MTQNPSVSTEMVQSLSIDNLINQRESVRLSLENARASLASADQIINAITAQYANSRLYGGVGQLACSRGHSHELRLIRPEGVAEAMQQFDATAWQHLMHASGLRSLMDSTAREKWDKAIAACETPALTRANIEATFVQLHGSRGDMFERGVIECFRRLSWRYKTNLPQKFGKRIVVAHLTGYHAHARTNEMDDLMRVMHILDGKPEADHRNGIYALLSDSGAFYNGRAGEVSNDYLRIKFYLNHNGHVEFKRPDLAEKMNLIIAKHYPGALPAPR